jgi:hypothetical protein
LTRETQALLRRGPNAEFSPSFQCFSDEAYHYRHINFINNDLNKGLQSAGRTH